VSTMITFVALDSHKKEHAVAVVYPHTGELAQWTVRNTQKDVAKMVKNIKRQTPGEVRFCYEAGVCGFVLKRWIEAHGCSCSVIAPSLIPVKPGERIKTDRRDARKLQSLFMAGQLTEVHAPSIEQEAARDLTRCRQTAQEDVQRNQHRLVKFLVRHGYVYAEGSHWTEPHGKWLESLVFEEALLKDVFDQYVTELEHSDQRLASLDKQVAQLAQSPTYRPLVELLCCFRGIDTLTAITLMTELFEFGRFESPQALMSYLGLVPSESSSGDQHHRGRITKTGNRRVRRLLIQAAWHQRHGYTISKTLRKRREGQPQWAIDLADKAGQRLRRRYRALSERGKEPCKAVVAIAREYSGFIWAMLREYQVRQPRPLRKTG
jgi:transposase